MADDNNKLRAKIAALENVLNSVGAYVFTKDLQGCYTFVNEKVTEVFDAPYEDILGKDDSSFFDLTLSDQLRQNDQKVMSENVVVETEEVNFIKATGEERVYKTVKKPLLGTNGQVIGLCGISTDITEQKRLEAINKEQKHLLDVVLDNVDAYVYMKDSNRHFKYVNDRVSKLFDKPVDNIVGRLDSEVLAPEAADHFWESDRLVFETGLRQDIHEEITDKEGNLRHYLSVKIPYQFEDDTKVLIGFSSDVTELYDLKERYQKQASTDSLTGLYNRRYFFEAGEREFNRAKRHCLPLSVISIDVDNFKRINDEFGHPVGDQVLLDVCQNMMPNIRSEDILARIGGEEFSVMLPDTTPEKAMMVAKRIREQQSASQFTANNTAVLVKVSVGVASLTADDSSFQGLYSRSDKALYQAKSEGKNRVYYLE